MLTVAVPGLALFIHEVGWLFGAGQSQRKCRCNRATAAARPKGKGKGGKEKLQEARLLQAPAQATPGYFLQLFCLFAFLAWLCFVLRQQKQEERRKQDEKNGVCLCHGPAVASFADASSSSVLRLFIAQPQEFLPIQAELAVLCQGRKERSAGIAAVIVAAAAAGAAGCIARSIGRKRRNCESR